MDVCYMCMSSMSALVIIKLHFPPLPPPPPPPLFLLPPSLPGGLMSVFLMGVYDKSCDRFRTVAKCGNGHDDATIMRLQDELDMVKISKVHVHIQSEAPGSIPGGCQFFTVL